MNYGKPNHSDSEQEENYKKKTSRKKKSESESEDDSGGEGKETKRKRGRPRTIKREDVEGFNDAEIRRLELNVTFTCSKFKFFLLVSMHFLQCHFSLLYLTKSVYWENLIFDKAKGVWLCVMRQLFFG